MTPDEFLSQQPFRKPLEVGSEFTVDGRTESHLGNDKIRGRAIIEEGPRGAGLSGGPLA